MSTNRSNGLRIITLVLLTFGISMLYGSGLSQTPDDSWGLPVNLSNSGSTINPAAVVDSDGITHVVWEDFLSGLVYTRKEGEQWSDPVVAELPFANRVLPGETGGVPSGNPPPTLIAGPGGFVHAFWVARNGELLYSKVLSTNFAEPGAWSGSSPVAESVVNFDVTTDVQGNLHVAYIRPTESVDFPAGVYYRHSLDNGASFSSSSLLYSSRYLRTATRDTSNIQIETNESGETEKIYIGWDNRPIKRVFLAKSEDGGLTWGPVSEVAAPVLESGAASAYGILVGVAGDYVQVIWQAGDPESSCRHFYQSSSDGGVTWSERLQMSEQLVGCATDQSLIVFREDFALQQKTIDGQVYFLIWNGQQWSEPELQEQLVTLVDPQSFDDVQLGCRSFISSTDSNMVSVAGCDADGAGDIWFTSRVIESTSDLFPPAPVWDDPLTVSIAAGQIESPILLTDSSGVVHLIWIQEDDIESEGLKKNIYYALWNGSVWTTPVAPFEDIDDDVVSLSASIGSNDILNLVWNDNNSLENSFTWANAKQALQISEWAEVQLLPFSQSIGSSPEVYVDQLNTSFIVSEKSINEGRGVYLIHSNDLGQSWSNPVQVFDAMSAEWPAVIGAHLNGTYDGRKHLIMTQYSAPGGPGSQALYYARSDDNDVNWLEPVLVERASISWSEILGYGDRVVHIIWEDMQSGRPVIRHQVSEDSGVSWSPIATISNFENALGEPSVTIDPDGVVHLNQIISETSGKLTLKQWIWDGERWVASDGTDLNTAQVEDIQETTSVATNLGVLNFAYSGIIKNGLSLVSQDALFHTRRSIELPANLPTFSPDFSPPSSQIPDQEPTPVITPAPVVTPTPTEVVNLENTPSTTNLTVLAIVFGGLIVIIIIVGFFVLRLRGYL